MSWWADVMATPSMLKAKDPTDDFKERFTLFLYIMPGRAVCSGWSGCTGGHCSKLLERTLHRRLHIATLTYMKSTSAQPPGFTSPGWPLRISMEQPETFTMVDIFPLTEP